MSSRLGIAGIVLLAAFGLAACGGGGGGTAEAPPPPEPTPQQTCVADGGRWNADMTCTSAAALLAERQADQRSAILTEINAATMALSVVTAAGDGATEAEVMAAEAAVARARAAIDAADDLPAAEIAQHNTALEQIDTPLMTARTDLNERQRVMDVAAARMAAMQSYMDADDYAMKAEAAANDAEATAPGSPGAMAAREAATAARMAADAAKMAHDAIMDDMTKAQADEQKDKAAAEVVKAMSQYMMAKRENDTIQTAAATGTEQQRMRDVAAARNAAGMAVMDAMKAKEAADAAAMEAEAARDAARAAYMHAMRARTDSEAAKVELDKAEAAVTAANAAADSANAAYMAAKSAADGIEDDGTAEAAQTAQMTAETKRDEAAEEAMTASTQQMTAKDAQLAAEMARDRHVIGLLIAANGQDITEPRIDNSATPENESMTVAQLRAAATGRAVTALNAAAGAADNGEAGTTATATWPGVVDDPDTDADESAGSVLSIMVDPEGSGTPMTFRTVAVEADPDATPPVAAEPQTAGNLAEGGLTGFPHGFSISDGTRHAIVFTDKRQGTPAVAEVTAIEAQTLANADAAAGTVTDLGTASGTGFTGVTFYASGVTVDDNTDSDLAFMGSLTCPDTSPVTACTAEVNADGTYTITGYRFSGNRAARAAVAAVAAMENGNYLAFGVWMDEDDDGNNTADDPLIGAFAAGGSPVTTLAQEITGTARYEGSATGVYTAGESVDYFQGDAELTADFGANDAQGTITGMIDNIVAGGNAMDDVIYLNDDGTPDDGNMVAGGTFSGDARMGTATTVDNVTTYTHNGSWSGQFFNAVPNDPATTEDESIAAPGSVAGTFGVTGTTGTGDDAVTRSYVGAFGAHKQ